MSRLPTDAVEHILSFLRPRHAIRAATACRRWASLYRCVDLCRTEPVAALTDAVPFLRCLRLSVYVHLPWENETHPHKSALRWAAGQQTWSALHHLTLDLRGNMNQDPGLLQTFLGVAPAPNLVSLELRVGCAPLDDATKRMVTDTLLARPIHPRSFVRVRADADEGSGDALTLLRSALVAGFTDVEYADKPFKFNVRMALPLNGDRLIECLADNSTGGFASCASLRFSFHALGEVPNGFVTVVAAERSLRSLTLRVRHGWRAHGWMTNGGMWDAWRPDGSIRRRRPDTGFPDVAPNHHLRRLRVDLAGASIRSTEFERLWSGAMRCFDALDELEIDARGSVVLGDDQTTQLGPPAAQWRLGEESIQLKPAVPLSATAHADRKVRESAHPEEGRQRRPDAAGPPHQGRVVEHVQTEGVQFLLRPELCAQSNEFGLRHFVLRKTEVAPAEPSVLTGVAEIDRTGPVDVAVRPVHVERTDGVLRGGDEVVRHQVEVLLRRRPLGVEDEHHFVDTGAGAEHEVVQDRLCALARRPTTTTTISTDISTPPNGCRCGAPGCGASRRRSLNPRTIASHTYIGSGAFIRISSI